MKQRWLFMLLGAVTLIMAGVLISWHVLTSSSPCSGEVVLREMDTVLSEAQSKGEGAPSKEVQQWTLLIADSLIWRKLQRLMADAPGKYQLILLALDQPFSPGDDAMVGAHLSNGTDIECTFYNSTITDCDAVDRIVVPEERAANSMRQLLQAARDNPIGPPPKDVLWAGFLLEGGPVLVWKDLQHWMSDAPGDFRVETPAHIEHQCEFVEYKVKAHLSNGLAIACQFSERLIQSCEEVK